MSILITLAKQNRRKAPIGQPNTIVFDIQEPRHRRKDDIDSMDEMCEPTNNNTNKKINGTHKKNGTNNMILCSNDTEMCCGCQRPISDRYIMRVMEHSWHETCLQCTVCRILLTQTCYIRDRKLYCKTDYDKLYGAKCTACLEPIAPTELVMRALDHVYHIACFLCVGCGRQLQKGDQFVIRAGRLFCRPDFEKEMALLQLSNNRSENSGINANSGQGVPSINANPQRQDGRRGPKRPRTILTTAQRRAFKASFEISQKPCRKVRETLAKETGLSVRIVQVWFQNQRAKLKKIQRKQQQIQQSQAGSESGGIQSQSSDKSKDSSTDSPQFSLPPLHYMNHSPDGSYYSPHDDGYAKSELAMDSETSLGGLEDVLINQSGTTSGGDATPNSIHHSDVGHNQLIGTPSMTPIDKLYSMQSLYFNSGDCECLGQTN